MSTDAITTPSPQSAAPSTVDFKALPGGLDALKLYEREIATYRRELPRLLASGESGRFALIKENDILSTWDTWGDAYQAGRQRFGLVPICVMKIDPRDPERYALLDAWLKSQCQP